MSHLLPRLRAIRSYARRGAGLTAPLTIGALIVLAPAARAQPLQVVPAGHATFPERSLVLSGRPLLSAPALSGAQIHIAENGRPIKGLTVRPIRKAGRGEFGVVLVIDTSPSMRGKPIVSAMAAARTLAARRTGQQALGVVEFNRTSNAVLAPTQNQRAIERALAKPPALGPGTHIYDAVQTSLALLERAGIAAGSVIILSDGADRGSLSTPESIIAAAKAAHVRIFTVGLRSKFFDPRTLSTLAQGGGGSFIEADSSRLRHIYARLGERLASEYLVSYRSQEGRGKNIEVTVQVDGIPGTWSTSYASPPPPVISRPPQHPAQKSFWTSALALVLVTSGSALLVGLAMALVLMSRGRSGSLRERVGKFIPASTPGGDSGAALLTGRVLGRAERSLQHQRWWAAFKEELEIARVERSATEIVFLTVAATLMTGALLLALTGVAISVLPALIGGPLVMRAVIGQRLRHQRSLFAEQLPGHLEELAAAMRAGHSMVGAIAAMLDGASEPTRSEFQRVLADEQLGMPLEEALHPVARRMANDDMEQVALVASLHHRTGGNMAEVLDRVADAVRERAELRRELHALTAQARLSRWIVTALPPAVLFLITAINPSYVAPLYRTGQGQLLLALAAAMVIAGSFVMKALVKVEA